MFVELIESLRCPLGHGATQLVATTSRTDARHIMEGVLGCPECGAEFKITGGVATFGAPQRMTPPEASSAEAAMRLAAFLDLTDARGFAILCGRWGAHLDALRRISETPIVLVNPPDGFAGDPDGVIVCRDAAPFADGSARAAALDAGQSDALVRSVAAAVRVGGRVIGPTTVALPFQVAEVTRDAELWIGEKTSLVTIKRA